MSGSCKSWDNLHLLTLLWQLEWLEAMEQNNKAYARNTIPKVAQGAVRTPPTTQERKPLEGNKASALDSTIGPS